MIVNRLALKPFGCFGSKTLDFSTGLNVVLGPNEAGKSTTFQALQKVLFVPASVVSHK
jgi:DNA repair protein SbcC/Rad50